MLGSSTHELDRKPEENPSRENSDGRGTDSSPQTPLLSTRSRSMSFPQAGLQLFRADEPLTMASSNVVTAKVAYTLYICHFLSTWNSRVYEFAAVLFISSAFPQNLLASSIFGMAMSVSLLSFASMLGTYVDKAPSRLMTLCSTIIANRASVVAACFCWLIVLGIDPPDQPSPWQLTLKHLFFGFIIIFGVMERLSRTANILSIERDWVPTMAPTTADSEHGPAKYGLSQLNAVMSRIDLICKLFAPIIIPAIIPIVGSMQMVSLVLLIGNTLSFFPEIYTARMVYRENNLLRAPKGAPSKDTTITGIRWGLPDEDSNLPLVLKLIRGTQHAILTAFLCIKIWFEDYRENIRIYFTYPVWMASMCLSVLHFSVLNYSATLIVYLVSSGFTVKTITLAKILSSVWEIGSTFVYPTGVRICGRLYGRQHGQYDGLAQDHDDDDEAAAMIEEDNARARSDDPDSPFNPEADMGVAGLGFWGLVQMVVSLIPAAFAIWPLSTPRDPSLPPQPPSTLIIVLLLSTIPMSRLGRWTNHLSTQQLTQTLVPASHRSGFAGAEMGLVNLFGMGHWMVTATWSAHEDFKWLAIASVFSVGLSCSGYWFWWQRERKEGARSVDMGRGRIRR